MYVPLSLVKSDLNLISFHLGVPSRFNLYEHFCSGHPEALEVVRKIQQQSPIEWDVSSNTLLTWLLILSIRCMESKPYLRKPRNSQTAFHLKATPVTKNGCDVLPCTTHLP